MTKERLIALCSAAMKVNGFITRSPDSENLSGKDLTSTSDFGYPYAVNLRESVKPYFKNKKTSTSSDNKV